MLAWKDNGEDSLSCKVFGGLINVWINPPSFLNTGGWTMRIISKFVHRGEFLTREAAKAAAEKFLAEKMRGGE